MESSPLRLTKNYNRIFGLEEVEGEDSVGARGGYISCSSFFFFFWFKRKERRKETRTRIYTPGSYPSLHPLRQEFTNFSLRNPTTAQQEQLFSYHGCSWAVVGLLLKLVLCRKDEDRGWCE